MSADLTLNDEAINLWRSTFRLNLNVGRKLEITRTVKDMELWKRVLSDWKANKWNPLKIGWQLSEYERRATDECNRTNGGNGQHAQHGADAEDLSARLPKRRDAGMPSVSEAERTGFRAGSKTLDDVLAEALFRMRTASRLEK